MRGGEPDLQALVSTAKPTAMNRMNESDEVPPSAHMRRLRAGYQAQPGPPLKL